MVGFQRKKVFITLKHSVDNLERSIFDDTTPAEKHLCFNKGNIKFWVINTFCFTRIFCGQEICVLFTAPLITGIIDRDKSVGLLVPEFHCLDNRNKNTCAVKGKSKR